MADVEIKITYETLYELLRREKSRETLQELSPTFYDDVADYIKEKIRILADQQRKLNMFSISEREKIEIQLNNVRKILADLYDRREKKIMSLAVNKSITNSHIVDTSNLLELEKKMYEQLLVLLNHYRHTRFFSVLHPREQEYPDLVAAAPDNLGPDNLGSAPDPTLPAEEAGDAFPSQSLQPKEEQSPALLAEPRQATGLQDNGAGDIQNPAVNPFPNPSSEVQGQSQYTPFDPASANTADPAGSKIVRIMTPLPSFLGLHGETYGPFDEEDVANLPDRIADILINKGKAEDLNDSDNNSMA